MAKKRLKKKQRKQDLKQKGINNPQLINDLLKNDKKYKKFDEVYNLYTSKQVDNVHTSEIAADPFQAEKIFKRREKDRERYVTRQERNNFLKSAGITSSEERKKIYQSNERYHTFYKNYTEEQERKNQTHMVIFWRDKTQEKRHGENVVDQKNRLRYLTNEGIIEHIQTIVNDDQLWSQHGEIEIKLTKDPQSLIKLYTGRTLLTGSNEEQKIKEQEWELVYSGTAKRKKQILIAIGGIVQLLYKGSKKEAIGEILQYVLQLNPKLGKEIASQLNFRKYEENKKSLFSKSTKNRRRQ